jgi:hypothetical protein
MAITQGLQPISNRNCYKCLKKITDKDRVYFCKKCVEDRPSGHFRHCWSPLHATHEHNGVLYEQVDIDKEPPNNVSTCVGWDASKATEAEAVDEKETKPDSK